MADDDNDPTSVTAAIGAGSGAVLARERQNQLAAEKASQASKTEKRELSPEEKEQQKRDNVANQYLQKNYAMAYEYQNRNWMRWRLMSESIAEKLKESKQQQNEAGLQSQAVFRGDFTHLKEGTYTPYFDDDSIIRQREDNQYNIEVKKNEAGGFTVRPVPPPKTMQDKVRSYGLCMDLLASKGLGTITIAFQDIDWSSDSNKLAKKIASENFMASAIGVNSRGLAMPGAEEMPAGTRALINSFPRRKPGEKTLRERLAGGELLSIEKPPKDQETYYELIELIKENAERKQLMSGQGTTEYFKGLSEELGARSSVSEDSYKKQLAGLSGNEKQTAIEKGLDELAKRAAALDAMKEKLSQGVKNLDQQYGKPEGLTERLQHRSRIFEQEPGVTENFNPEKTLEQVQKNVAENHLPAVKELREAIEKEQKNLEAMEAALKGELDVTFDEKAEAAAGVDAVESPVADVTPEVEELEAEVVDDVGASPEAASVEAEVAAEVEAEVAPEEAKIAEQERRVDEPDKKIEKVQEKEPEVKAGSEPESKVKPKSKASPEQEQKLAKVHKQLEAMKEALEKAKKQEEKLKTKYNKDSEPQKKQGAKPGGPS